MSNVSTRTNSSANWSKLIAQCEMVSNIFSSLAHPVRIKILCSLLHGDRTVSQLTDECRLEQPVVSQFLARMRADGLVSASRMGRQMHYRIAEPNIEQLLSKIQELYCNPKTMKGKTK